MTIIFKCPSSISDITGDSSPICKPYLQGRDQLLPYVKPYYEAYAAPYVNLARPYAETVQSKVYAPAAEFAESKYQEYAAPLVLQGRQYGEREWDRVVKPHADKWTAKVWEQYSMYLEPSVRTAKESIIESIYPQLQRASNAAAQQYHTVLVPSIQGTLPYMQKGYDQGYHWVMDVGYPYSSWAGQTTLTFVTRKIWPTLQVLYGQNVEPQLSKIRERLSSYRDSRKLEAALQEEFAK